MKSTQHMCKESEMSTECWSEYLDGRDVLKIIGTIGMIVPNRMRCGEGVWAGFIWLVIKILVCVFVTIVMELQFQ